MDETGVFGAAVMKRSDFDADLTSSSFCYRTQVPTQVPKQSLDNMSVPVFQMLVRVLDGTTSCLQFPSSTIAGSLLHHRLSDISGIAPDHLFIVSGCRVISPQVSLFADTDGFFPSCSLLLRLRGGKGGFGSLLRGAATKAGQKKTSNFDACRDMSGRRLRHVNAEKKLKEWKAQAKERELEKAANTFIKKHLKQKQVEADYSEDVQKFREETSRAREEVASAVASGLTEAKAMGKRKILEEMPTSSKRPCIWPTDEGAESSEDEDAYSENDLADDKLEEEPTDEREENFAADMVEEGSADVVIDQDLQKNNHFVDDQGNDLLKIGHDDEGTPCTEEGKFGHPVMLGELPEIVHADSDGCGLDENSPKKVDCNWDGANLLTEELVTVEPQKQEGQGQLNFDDFQSAADMEVLGLEKLKFELKRRGLKCGGSLGERAARLFLLKACSLEKLDKKHFAKPNNGATKL